MVKDIILMQFTVENYACFSAVANLNLEKSSYNFGHNNSCLETGDTHALAVSAIFGANASGKTYLLKAFSAMAELVTAGLNVMIDDMIMIQRLPFAFSESHQKKPTRYLVRLFIEDTICQYGFSISHYYPDESSIKKYRIDEEWLEVILDSSINCDFEFDTSTDKRIMIFHRYGLDSIDVLNDGSMLSTNISYYQQLLQEHMLLLSVLRTHNIPIAVSICDWYSESEYVTLDGASLEEIYADKCYSMFYMLLKDSNLKNKCISIMREFDPCIVDIEVIYLKDIISSNGRIPIYESDQLLKIYAVHNRYEDNLSTKKAYPFAWESNGTKRLFFILPSLMAALEKGSLILIDELDMHLHPGVLSRLLNLFHNPEINMNGAQLIFNSHNILINNSDDLRIDEVWFTEKTVNGHANLKSLLDYYESDPLLQENPHNWVDNYKYGRYGAVPYISEGDERIGTEA